MPNWWEQAPYAAPRRLPQPWEPPQPTGLAALQPQQQHYQAAQPQGLAALRPPTPTGLSAVQAPSSQPMGLARLPSQPQLDTDAQARYQQYAAMLPSPDSLPQQPKPQQSGLLSDIGNLLKSGYADTARGLNWLAGKVPGLNQVIDAESGQQYWGDVANQTHHNLSQAQQDASKKTFLNDDGSLGDAWADPRAYLGTVVESVPGTVMGMGMGGPITSGLQRIGLAALPRLGTVGAERLAMGTGAIGYGTGEGLTAAGSDAVNARDVVLQRSHEDLQQNSPQYRDLLASMTPDQARAKLAEEVANQVGLEAGLTVAATGAPMGAAFGKLFHGGGKLGTSRLGSVGIGAAGEMSQEFVQSGAERFLQNKAVKENVDPTQDLWQGVPNEAVSGALAGGIMGGAMAGGGHGSATANTERAADSTIAGIDQARNDLLNVDDQTLAKSLESLKSLQEQQQLSKDQRTRVSASLEALQAEIAKRSSPESVTAPWDSARGGKGYLEFANRAHELSDGDLAQAIGQSVPENAPDAVKAAQALYQNESDRREAVTLSDQYLQSNPGAKTGITNALEAIVSGKPLTKEAYGSTEYNLATISDEALKKYRNASTALLQHHSETLGKKKESIAKAETLLTAEIQRRSQEGQRDPLAVLENDLIQRMGAINPKQQGHALSQLAPEALDRVATELEKRVDLEPKLAPHISAIRDRIAKLSQATPEAATPAQTQEPIAPMPERTEQPAVSPSALPDPLSDPTPPTRAEQKQSLGHEVDALNQAPPGTSRQGLQNPGSIQLQRGQSIELSPLLGQQNSRATVSAEDQARLAEKMGPRPERNPLVDAPQANPLDSLGAVNAPDAVQQQAKPVDTSANKEGAWAAFPPETGSLGVPRAQMPQIKAEHRGALVNFLKGRGIEQEADTVPAALLKPTQVEFSPQKVQQALDFKGGNRSILVSQDNHVVDGHHQWLAALQKHESVPIIRLNAPIAQVLNQVQQFPSATSAPSSTRQETATQAQMEIAHDPLSEKGQAQTAPMLNEGPPASMGVDAQQPANAAQTNAGNKANPNLAPTAAPATTTKVLPPAPRWNQATTEERTALLQAAGVTESAIPQRAQQWGKWSDIPEGGAKARLRQAMKKAPAVNKAQSGDQTIIGYRDNPRPTRSGATSTLRDLKEKLNETPEDRQSRSAATPAVRSSRPGQTLTPQEKVERILREDQVLVPVNAALQEKHGKELRDAADVLYRELQPAVNEVDGKTVRFVRKAFKEMRQHSADERVMLIVPSLPHLFQKATPLWSEQDDGSHGRVSAWHNYGVRASINGQDTVVRLVAREMEDGTLELLHYDADVRDAAEIKNAMSGLAERSQQPKPGGQQNLSSRKDRLLQWVEKIHLDNKSRLSRDSGFSQPLSSEQARTQLVEALGEQPVKALERSGRLIIHEADPTQTGAAGFVDHNGVIHLVASNLENGDALSVALHEAMHVAKDDRFHEGNRAHIRLAHAALRLFGLKNFIGNPSFTSLVQEAYRLAAAGNKTAQQALAKAQAEYEANPQTDVPQELVAYLAQYADEKLPLVRRIISAIRATMYRMGIKVQLTPADVRALALSALKAQARAAAQQRNSRPSEREQAAYSMAEFAPTDADRAEVARQMASIKEVRDEQGRLIAPNGKPSNLNEWQWKAVRTDFFKRWFGDWETDPSNASQALDENGEPLAVYHGTNATKTVAGRYREGDPSAVTQLQEIAKQHGIPEDRWDDAPSILERWHEFGLRDMEGYRQGERYHATAQTVDTARRLQELAKGTAEASQERIGFNIFRMPGKTKELGSHFGTQGQAMARGVPFQFFLKMSNPLRMLDLGTWNFKDVIAEAKKRGVEITAEDEVALAKATNKNDAARHLLLAKGIDGIVYRNDAEGAGDSYIAIAQNQIKSATDNTGTFSPRSPRIDYSQPNERDLTDDQRFEYAVAGLKILASHRDLFKYPISQQKDIAAIAADLSPEIKVSAPDTSRQNPLRAYRSFGQSWTVTMPDGATADVLTSKSGREVYIDASGLEKGQSTGSLLYQLVGQWAYNNGKVFVGDPEGISPAGKARRLEHLISLALKFGTTDHFMPHPDQNIPWRVGDHGYNLAQMLKASSEIIQEAVPAIREMRYGFGSGTGVGRFIESATGRVVGDDAFQILAKSPRARAAQAGATTLKRSVLVDTVVQGAGRAGWRPLLGELARLGGVEQLDPALKDLFYSQPASETDAAEQERLWAEFQAVRAQFQTQHANTTAFQRWFGDGVEGITAKDGKPLTLYHGTPTEFYRFDASRSGKNSQHPTSGLGFFMTADRGAAARYGANVLELHAKINTPYYLTDADLMAADSVEAATKLKQRLQEKGYDGAVVTGPGMAPYVIAFESKQVKLTSNQNPTESADFRYSMPDDAERARHRAFLEGTPVAVLTGNEFSKDGVPLTVKVPQWYAQHGDSLVNAPGIGEVMLDVRAVKDSIAHGLGKNKAAAFAAVPDVLRKGRLLHKAALEGSRGQGAAYFVGAPVTLGGKRMVEVVVVKSTLGHQRMYVHEVALLEPLQDAFKTGADASFDGALAGAEPGAIRSLLQSIFSVNPIRYSRPGRPAPSAALPTETRVQAFQRTVQDKFVRFEVVQKWLKESGIDLTPEANVYGAEALLPKKTAAATETARDTILKPLIQRAAKNQWAIGGGQLVDAIADSKPLPTAFKPSISEYLHAAHAKERNAQIAKINPKFQDGGSGLTNAQADAILARYRGMAGFSLFQKLAGEFQAITKQTRDTLLHAGIISQEMAKAWDGAYSSYVPLKGGPEDGASRTGTGGGISVNGKQRRALGHGLRDEKIIENIWRDHERAIYLAHKQEVARSLREFLTQANNAEIGTVGQPEKRAILHQGWAHQVWIDGAPLGVFPSYTDAKAAIAQDSQRTGRSVSLYAVRHQAADPSVIYTGKPMLGDNEVALYEHGQLVRLQLNDDLLARAARNLGADAATGLLKAGQQFNRWLSAAYTGYSPEFLVTNPVRDFTAGFINLTGQYGVKMASKALLNYPSAVKALWTHIRTGSDPLIDHYRKAGGSTGAAYLSDLERIGTDIKRVFQDLQGAKETWESGDKVGAVRVAAADKVRLIGGWIEKLNQIGENALRVATFKTLLEENHSEADAARAAGGVTVNFNRKGELSTQLGGLYLFFNPSVQGTKAMWDALAKGPHRHQAQVLAGALAGLAFFLAQTARGGSDDDEKRWKAIPGYTKDRNMLIPLGNGDHLTIPVPYGYGAFWALGNLLSDVAHGENGTKVGIRLASTVFEQFSPVGNPFAGDEADSRNIVSMLPTALKPAVSLAMNRSELGRPIMPDVQPWNPSKPDSQRMWRATQGTIWEQITTGLNRFTGGDKYHAGLVDVSPESLKTIWRTLTGGAGQFAADTGNLLMVLGQGAGEETTIREIPFLRKFVRESSIQDARTLFHEQSARVREAESMFSAAKRDRDPEAMRSILRENREVLLLGRVLDAAGKQIKARRQVADAIERSDLPLAAKRRQLETIERQEEALYSRFHGLFLGAERKQAQAG
ncbi:MAG: LPD38 domain-containing protein [Candidatus Saccharimonadales bacterium]